MSDLAHAFAEIKRLLDDFSPATFTDNSAATLRRRTQQVAVAIKPLDHKLAKLLTDASVSARLQMRSARLEHVSIANAAALIEHLKRARELLEKNKKI